MSQSQVAGIELIDGPFGVWDIAPSMEKGAVTDETCQEMFEIETIAEEKVREKRILKFCEVYVYVDQGNLSVYLARNYGDVEVPGFSLSWTRTSGKSSQNYFGR